MPCSIICWICKTKTSELYDDGTSDIVCPVCKQHYGYVDNMRTIVLSVKQLKLLREIFREKVNKKKK